MAAAAAYSRRWRSHSLENMFLLIIARFWEIWKIISLLVWTQISQLAHGLWTASAPLNVVAHNESMHIARAFERESSRVEWLASLTYIFQGNIYTQMFQRIFQWRMSFPQNFVVRLFMQQSRARPISNFSFCTLPPLPSKTRIFTCNVHIHLPDD